MQYIRTVFVVGLLTIRGSHKERWRNLGVAFLVLAAICEGWWIMSVAVGRPKGERPTRGPDVVMVRFQETLTFIFG
jgi:Na+/phosphate symporter